MLKVEYEKLRQLDTEPLVEFEQQILEKMKRELEAKKRGDDKKKGKKKGRR
ncbi:MAG: hypothetical protein GF393_02200 [Armatimonadia bacterium]|nr:hypothetical protein [Armatimonadia bacterium]